MAISKKELAVSKKEFKAVERKMESVLKAIEKGVKHPPRETAAKNTTDTARATTPQWILQVLLRLQ